MLRRILALVGLITAFGSSHLQAQRPVTVAEAIESALARGPRAAILIADSMAADARVTTARAYPNPLVSIAYAKSPPNYQIEAEQEIELPFLRAARIRAALATSHAARYNVRAERAIIRYDVETAYAAAAAAASIRVLGARNAADALEMLRITREREKVGDASELDVRLASVAAGQAQNQAATDSLQAIVATLQLQALMGLDDQDVAIIPADSLASIVQTMTTTAPAPLLVSAAEQQVAAEQANLQLARSSRIPSPSLRVGVEFHDPETGNKPLPTFGVAIPLPLWNRNGGQISEASAAVARATADLRLVQLETQNAIAIAEQQQAITQQKVERSHGIVVEAQRVASLAVTAYREGAYPLASVLEAQRNARDALRQYIEDVQASRVAIAAVTRARLIGGPTP